MGKDEKEKGFIFKDGPPDQGIIKGVLAVLPFMFAFSILGLWKFCEVFQALFTAILKTINTK